MSEQRKARLPDPNATPGADADGAPLRVPVGESEAPPEESGEADEGGLPQFVSVLATMEQQVGSHVITALQHSETVAVLTTVAMGPDGQQRIVSIGLDPAMVEQVRGMVAGAREQTTKDVPCVGFHCRIQREDVARKEKERGHDQV